jgi:hypothetical protein
LFGISPQAYASSNGILTQGLSSSTSSPGTSASLSALTSATATNTITNGAFAQEWDSTALILTATGATTPLTLTNTGNTAVVVTGNASLSGTTTIGTAQIGAGNATLTLLTASTVTGTTISGSNASLTGTTTLSTAKILGGNIDATIIGATTSSTALFSTITVGSLTDKALTAGYVESSAAGVISSANLAPRMLPLSLTTTDTAGNLFPYTLIGTGGNASPASPAWGVAASLGADVVLQGRFLMPHVLPPSGTLNLVSLCQAAAGSGTAKYTISDADVAAGSDPSAASLSAETQTSLAITVTGGYALTATPLTETPVADHVSVIAVTFNHTSWTLAQILACNWFEQFQ